MNYQETLSYLYEHLPFFQKQGKKAIKEGLKNIEIFLHHLGNPHHSFKTIHVGGTNGKGSSSHFLASILKESGYKTGLYTSPHLKDFRERFKINGSEVAENEIINFVATHRDFIEKLNPSFFEVTVAFAFDWFAKQKVDVAVIEVGLGGGKDSTNVILPELSLITNIGYDHKDILGDTLEQIAGAKAGIIKAGIPVVISEKKSETFFIFQEKAEKVSAPLYTTENLIFLNSAIKDNFQIIEFYDKNAENSLLIETPLLGNYQQKNVAGVYVAVHLLAKLFPHITETSILLGFKNVLKNTNLKGRWQILSNEPLTVCDTGHNSEAFQYIIKQLESTDKVHYFYILGFAKDKDSYKLLNNLRKPCTFLFSSYDSHRSFIKEDFQRISDELKIDFHYFSNVNLALQFATEKATKNDFIFIGGSTYLVSELNNL